MIYKNMHDSYIIAELIRRMPGYVVEMRGLYVSKMTNGKYHVVSEIEDGEPIRREFENPYAAADFFVQKRREFKLGFDITGPVELPIVSASDSHTEMFVG
jgi:hypothetical protein